MQEAEHLHGRVTGPLLLQEENLLLLFMALTILRINSKNFITALC